jgi:prepilin-type N-terminal cleavage/methylation domain-containing protein
MDNKQDKGFTLVELLIVIVILGILATVTVFAVRGITDQWPDQSACNPTRRRAIADCYRGLLRPDTGTQPGLPRVQTSFPTSWSMSRRTPIVVGATFTSGGLRQLLLRRPSACGRVDCNP